MRRLVERQVRFAEFSKTCFRFSILGLHPRRHRPKKVSGNMYFENMLLLCLLLNYGSFLLSPRLVWVPNGHVYRRVKINFTKSSLN